MACRFGDRSVQSATSLGWAAALNGSLSPSDSFFGLQHGRLMQSPSDSQQNSDAHTRFMRLNRFLAQDPGNLGLRSQTIAAAFAAGAWNEAESLLREGLNQAPESAELHAHAGYLALRNQQYADAQLHFETAVANGLSLPQIRYNLAFAQFQQGLYQQALNSLNAIAAEEAMTHDMHLLLARCLHHLGQREAAIQVLQTLASDKPEAEGLLALLLHELDRQEDALAAANRALATDPNQLEALLARASTFIEQDQFAAARQDLEYATQVHPHCGRAWSGLAQLDFRDFNFDHAQHALEKAVAEMPNHIGTWHMLAWLCIMKGDVAQAKSAFQRSYEIDRNFGETHGGLAVIAALEGQPKLAEEYIKRAKRLNPNGFAANYANMLLLEQQGKAEEAKALFNRVMETTHPDLGTAPGLLVARRLEELQQQNKATRH